MWDMCHRGVQGRCTGQRGVSRHSLPATHSFMFASRLRLHRNSTNAARNNVQCAVFHVRGLLRRLHGLAAVATAERVARAVLLVRLYRAEVHHLLTVPTHHQRLGALLFVRLQAVVLELLPTEAAALQTVAAKFLESGRGTRHKYGLSRHRDRQGNRQRVRHRPKFTLPPSVQCMQDKTDAGPLGAPQHSSWRRRLSS